MNYGFIPPKEDKEDFKLGKLSAKVIDPDGDWTNYVPLFEAQKRQLETYNCTSFATLNCIEAIILRKYGITVNYSDRASGVLAGTYPPGNDPKTVAQAIRRFGIIDEELYPFSDDIKTVKEYYKELPKHLKKKAGKWLDIYELSYEWVFEKDDDLDFKKKAKKWALTLSPLGISVDAWNKDGDKYVKRGRDSHWTMLVKENKVYDSYIADGNPFKELDENYDNEYCMRYNVERITIYNPKNKGLLWIIIKFIKKLWKNKLLKNKYK